MIAGFYILLPLTGSNSSVQAITLIDGINDGTYEGFGMGFGGVMNTEVTINNKKITNINDDSVLVKKINHSVGLVLGDPMNFKIKFIIS